VDESFIDSCPTRNPLDDVSHLGYAHSMRIPYGDKNGGICILALIKVTLKPNLAADIKINFPFFIPFSSYDG
jgi:hypothetical protein